MEAGTCCCPEYSQIKSESECREAVLGVGIQNLSFSGLNPNLPSGCSAQYGSNGSFNAGSEFDSRGDMLPICKHAFGPAATTGAQFYRMPLGSAACQTSHKISSVEECVGAAGALGLIAVSLESPWVGENAAIPVGCSHQYGGRAHWNRGASGKSRPDMSPMCARPPTEDLKYFRMPLGRKGCDDYEPIYSIEECKVAAAVVGFDTNIAQTIWEGISSAIPLSCSGQLGGRPHYNYDSVGGSRADIFPICKHKGAFWVEPTWNKSLVTSKQCRWIGDSADGDDQWCDDNCNNDPPHCPATSCECSGDGTPDCAPQQKCYAVGDPHYLSSFGAGKFDFMGKGLFQIAANKEGSFKVQAFQCPANNGNPGAAVFKAFALFVNGDTITIINNEVLVNGIATNQSDKGYTISGTPNANSGYTVTANPFSENCKSIFNIKRKTKARLGAGWYRFDLSLLLADVSSSYGICTGAVQTSQPDCVERLFTEDQMLQIATNCNMVVPDCANPTPVPPPTSASEICN